MNIMLIMLT